MNSDGNKIEKQEPNQQLSCQEFRKLLDKRKIINRESRDRFNQHLIHCQACAAEAKLESALRGVIAPEKLPSSPPGFESRLKNQLVLESNVSINRRYWFGWLVPALTVVLLTFVYLKGIWSAIHRFAILLYADMAGHLAGWAALNKESLVANMTILQGLNAGLVINLTLALIVVFIGLVALKWSTRNHPVTVY